MKLFKFFFALVLIFSFLYSYSDFNIVYKNVKAVKKVKSFLNMLENDNLLQNWCGLGKDEFGKLGRDIPKGILSNDELRNNFSKKYDQDIKKNWKLSGNKILFNNGKGPYLSTRKAYGDVEIFLEFRLLGGVETQSDSGIYLKAQPQIQIWNTLKSGGKWKHGSDKGSGGLWNNNNKGGRNQTRFPLIYADKPIGEWNTLQIRQIGSRTWVWLNGQKVVNGIHMDHLWSRYKKNTSC